MRWYPTTKLTIHTILSMAMVCCIVAKKTQMIQSNRVERDRCETKKATESREKDREREKNQST